MKIIKALLVLSTVLVTTQANALVRIKIDEGNVEPLPLAITNLQGNTNIDDKLGANITKVVEDNLRSSGLFNIIDRNAFLQTEESLRLNGPNFEDWKRLNVEGLFTGTSQLQNDDTADALDKKAVIEYRLFDVYSDQQTVGKKYTAKVKFWRHIANRISDDIYTALTGEKGYFTSRIAYIGENKVTDKRGRQRTIKQLCVMNQDSSSQQCLTDGRSIVLTPRFSPVEQKIAYLSYANGRPRVYILDLTTGQQEVVGAYKGLNAAPRFSPDGKKLLMTLTKDEEGNSEIYQLDLDSKKLKRLTFSSSSIDTSPSYSPDGKRIVFNSDRAGRPVLYTMDSDGNNIKRLTYGAGQYYAPVWSPRGDMIAFVKQIYGKFHIGVIDIDEDGRASEERLLTEGFLDESPSWSPNGRVIIFARQTKKDTKIYAIDLTGYNLREVPTTTNASDPTWSPLLK
jgi:TolB protein